MKKRGPASFGSLSAALLGAMVAFQYPCKAIPTPPSFTEAQKSWKQVQTKGTQAFEANEFGKAERLLKEATVKARIFPEGDARFAASAGELGELLTVRGRFSEAEPYLEEELRLKRAAINNDNGQLIASMGSLVKFYLNYGTASKADPLVHEVLFFVEGKLREEDEAQNEAQKLKKGSPLVGWAGQAAPVMRDPLIEWAITCDDLGNQYRARGDYHMADRLYKAALDVKATVLGKQHLSLANSYDSLGSLCLLQNDYTEAESYFRDAVTITERIEPPEAPSVYNRVDKLARCLIKEGKNDEAEQLYLNMKKALDKSPSTCGNEARVMYALGCLYSDEKKYAQAAPILAKALKLSESFNGASSISLVPYLQKYAYVLYYLGDKGAEEAAKARAETISPTVQALKPTMKMEAAVWPK